MKPRPCPDCQDTGKTCGAPDCGPGCKCPTCWCDDCGFAPCECICEKCYRNPCKCPSWTVVCAWCNVTISLGLSPATHGICPPCAVKFKAEVDSLNNPK